MLLRTFVLSAASLAVAFAGGAQDVRVEVVKHADGRPIPGTLVTLLHERDSTQLGRFSDPNGRTTFNAPRRGGYRIRVEKVGYDTWTSVMLVPSSSPTRVRAGMKPRSLRLPPVTGKGETHCSNLAEQATVAGDMWGEIRKALAANRVTDTQGLVALDIETYDRILDATGHVISEKNERHKGNTLRPYRVIHVAARTTEQPSFSVPDASTLLSEEFVANHCFASIRGYGPENGLLGLEFKPAKLGTKPDLSGVLWLDPTTYSLRHVVFDYVNIPVSLRAGRATGRIDFQPLSGGEWIVSRWHIKTPRAPDAASSRTTITGYHEIGGAARGTGGVAIVLAAVAVSTGETRITGSVFDGTTGNSLSGVDITSTSGRHRTSTNSGGGYELWMDGAVVDSLIFDHPRLRLLRVPRLRPVSVASGGHAQVSIVIPPFASLRQALCPASGPRTQPPGLAIGYVRDAAGNPVANARVSATWQLLWTEEKGRLVATKQRRTVDAQTGADGSYLLCGFTRDVPITMTVTLDGIPRAEETAPLPRNMALERDFRIRTQ